MFFSAWPIIPIILSVRSCYTLYIVYNTYCYYIYANFFFSKEKELDEYFCWSLYVFYLMYPSCTYIQANNCNPFATYLIP